MTATATTSRSTARRSPVVSNELAGSQSQPITFPDPLPTNIGRKTGNKVRLERDIWLAQGATGRSLRVPAGDVIVISSNCYQPVTAAMARELRWNV